MSGKIIWNGAKLPFVAGETLAQALARAGIRAFGPANTDHGRSVFCGIGQCQNCLVEIAGSGPREACLTLCRDGLAARPVGDGHG